MFGGIIETTGTITQSDTVDGCKQLTISPTLPLSDLTIGDSISVNGVCLTITHFTASTFNVTLVPETLRLTTLNQLEHHGLVNLERALTLHKRIGGHYVQGHVDGTGKILDIQRDNSSAWLVKIGVAEKLSTLIVPKGYISIDGMSITVIETTSNWFTVTLIPHTQAVTIANHYQVGADVNIEVDILGKYILNIMRSYDHANRN